MNPQPSNWLKIFSLKKYLRSRLQKTVRPFVIVPHLSKILVVVYVVAAILEPAAEFKTEEEGKNPFQLDSKEPNWEDFQGFLKGEVRYASVMKQYPAEAEELFKAAEENAKWRYNSYKRLARENWGAE